MKKNETSIRIQNRRLIGMLTTVSLLLCIPLIAMQFTDEVKWSLSDFVIMGILLLSMCICIELVIREMTNRKYRIIICLTVLFLFFLIWAQLAVNIFGTMVEYSSGFRWIFQF